MVVDGKPETLPDRGSIPRTSYISERVTVGYKDKKKQRTYQNSWMRKKRDKWLAKLGPCVKCGSTERMVFHHKDPSTKVSHRIWSWKEERIAKELEKCEVLCTKCHVRHHLGKPPIHGTNAGYTGAHRCRCVECKAAHAKANLAWKRSKERPQ